MLHRLNQKNKRLTVALDAARLDAAKQRGRADRWEHAAFEMAPSLGPKAIELCLIAAMEDDVRGAT